jgi:DNA-binding transcriptional LysR family regulator
MGMIVRMREADLARIDLNLLVALRALLAERSVTRAAARLGLSQPAASRALSRLRETFGDPLLVRTRDGLVPTPRAAALEAPLARLLDDVRDLVRRPEFDPATARGRFALAAVDYVDAVLLPALAEALRARAPGIDLVSLPSPRDPATALAALAEGRWDLQVMRFDGDAPAGIYRRRLFGDDLVCMLRRDHPALRDGLTAETFAALDHVLITVTDDRPGPVDEALAARGLARRIAVRVPHFLAAPLVAARTDAVLTMPRLLAGMFADWLPVALAEPPLPLAGFEIVQLWHERRHGDPAHAWLRALVREVAAAIDREVRPPGPRVG